MPHPDYAWMSWVQILNPTIDRLDSLRDLRNTSLVLARDKWAGAAADRRPSAGEVGVGARR
jgi:ethanolamine utilization microcompartment shell protein EutL